MSSLFWKVYKPETPQVYSVLFGTVHLPISDRDIISKVDQYIDQYDHIYTETEIGEMAGAQLTQVLLLPPEHIRSDYINDRQWRRARKIFLKSYKVDIAELQMYRPMIQVSQFYEGIIKQKSSLKLDHYIWQSATEQGKTTSGIEALVEQARTMRSIPISYDYKLLKKWSRNVSKMNKEMSNLLTLYRSGSIDKLYKQSTRSLGSMRSLLLTDRNDIMVNRIYDAMELSPGFFTFGAGHLGGYHGVLRGLKTKGLQVQPIF